MNEQTHTAVHTAVIGGGLAGLTAAATLARAGKQVLLLEKAQQLGGRAISQQRGDFTFNLGPHALYVGGGASDVLAELGVPWTGHKPSLRGFAVYQNRLVSTARCAPGFVGGELAHMGGEDGRTAPTFASHQHPTGIGQRQHTSHGPLDGGCPQHFTSRNINSAHPGIRCCKISYFWQRIQAADSEAGLNLEQRFALAVQVMRHPVVRAKRADT
ncbi:MAG: NAD(P)-binding protein, partial [Anaerolineae bacterium]|nr:NAD(P)-binding protein [Anaerolineae bacterium]